VAEEAEAAAAPEEAADAGEQNETPPEEGSLESILADMKKKGQQE